MSTANQDYEGSSHLTPYTLAMTGAAIAASAYYLLQNPDTPVTPLAPIHQQTVEVEGQPGVRRLNHPSCREKLVERPRANVSTLYENFINGSSENGPNPCLGTYDSKVERYTWQTYDEVTKRFTNLGSGLCHLGQEVGAKIGVYSGNNAEWVLTEQACNAYSFVLVPLYDTLGPDAIGYITDQVSLGVVVCHDKTIGLLLNGLHKMPTVRTIIKIGAPITDDEVKTAANHNVTLYTFAQVETIGQENPHPHHPPTPECIATIQYTSGTTGLPKGAILSHRNMVAAMAGALVLISAASDVTNTDTHFSYLPLAHSFERLIETIMFMYGARVGFYRGDTRLVLEDLKLLKPTLFIAVPRVLNRIYDKIMDQVNSGSSLRKRLFYFAMEQKRDMIRRGIVTNKSIYDRIVFSKIQAALGGKLRGIVSGAAPLAPNVLDFFRCTMGCYVMSGYGLTESAAASCVTLPGDICIDTVGPPMPCTEIKLVDVPDMGFIVKDGGRGEVCIRGPSVFQGYYKDPVNTDDMIRDGWLYTGDIGEWNADGALKIVDRRKHMFKLAQGEYIVPEKIETAYSRVPGLAQIYIYGESDKTAVVALVVVDEVNLPIICKKNGLGGSADDIETLCAADDVKKYMLGQLMLAGQEAGLYGFEQAKAVYLTNKAFTVENNLMTPTFKVKRPTVKAFYQSVFAQLYNDLGM